MPKLVRFVLKWNAAGICLGWLVLAALLYADVSGIGSMVWRQPGGLVALAVLMLSFAVTSGPLGVTVAVLMQADFGHDGGREVNRRLERWKAGHSAELDDDRPLP